MKILKIMGISVLALIGFVFVFLVVAGAILEQKKQRKQARVAAVEIPAITVGETGRAYYDGNGNAYTPDIHYITVNYNKSEIPLKNSITHEVLAQGVIKEAYLSALMVQLYQDAMEVEFNEYKNRPRATHVQIIVFDKYENRLSILNKIGNTSPDIMYFLDSVDQ